MQDCVGTVDVEKVLSATSPHVWQQLGVRILCSEIMELCYALMLTLFPYYAPQTDHYAP